MAYEGTSKPGTNHANHFTVDELLSHIQWSQQSLPLALFVEQYQLPQIVKVEAGYYGAQDESSLSAGQILKVHYTRIARRVRAFDRVGNEVHIPLHTQHRVVLRPKNYKVVYHSVADVANAMPRPRYVEITQGYYNVDSSDSQELSIEPGEKLEVGGVEVLTIRGQHCKYMTFISFNGVEVKLPFSCMAGFKPWDDIDEHLLEDVVGSRAFPILVQFTGDGLGSERPGGNALTRLGVLKLEKVYAEELIVASCGHGGSHVIFTIPKSLAITVKVAAGTLEKNPLYDEICNAYHDLSDLETKVIESLEKDVFSGPGGLKEYEYETIVDSKIYSGVKAIPLVIHEENGRRRMEGDLGWHGILYEDSPVQEGTCTLITLPEERDHKAPEVEAATHSSTGSTETFDSRSSTLDCDPYSSKGEADDELEYEYNHNSLALGPGKRSPLVEGTGMGLTQLGKVKNGLGGEDTPRGMTSVTEREALITPTLMVTPMTPSFGSQVTIKDAELVANPAYNELSSGKGTNRSADHEKRLPIDSASETDESGNAKSRGALWNNLGQADSGNLSSASDGYIYASRTKSGDRTIRSLDSKLRSLSFGAPINQHALSRDSLVSAQDKVRSLSNPVVTESQQPVQTGFSFSRDLSHLSIEDVCLSLRELNLGHLEDTFRHNQVNGGLLVCLDDESLKDLKLSSFERRKLLNFIQGWRPDK